MAQLPRSWPIAVLAAAAGAQATVADLIDQLEDSDLRIRAIARLAKMDEQCVPRLVDAFRQTDDPYLASSLALVLGRLGRRATAAVEPLVAKLGMPDREFEQTILWALSEIAPHAEAPEPALLKLSDRGLRYRSNTSQRLLVSARVTLGRNPTTEALDAALTGKPWQVAAAARVLTLGHRARTDLLARLTTVLRESCPEAGIPVHPTQVDGCMVAVAEAVAAIDPSCAEATLANAYLLLHLDPSVRVVAMQELRARAPTGIPWLRYWRWALEDYEPSVRREALIGLESHGDGALLLIPGMRAATFATRRELRIMARRKLDTVKSRLSPIALRAHGIIWCEKGERSQRELDLARHLGLADRAALELVAAMPEFFEESSHGGAVRRSVAAVMHHLEVMNKQTSRRKK